MSSPAGAGPTLLLQWISRWIPPVVAACALLALAGWVLDLPALTSLVPGLTPMNPLTAVCFLMSCASLRFLRDEAPSWPARRGASTLAILTTLAAAARIADYLTGSQFGFDQIMFREKLDVFSAIPNRMAPNTAVIFLLLGLSLFCQGYDRPVGHHASQILALIAAGFALITLTGYAYNALFLVRLASYIPMALNTALSFLALSIAILASRPQCGLMPVALRFLHRYHAVVLATVAGVGLTGLAFSAARQWEAERLSALVKSGAADPGIPAVRSTGLPWAILFSGAGLTGVLLFFLARNVKRAEELEAANRRLLKEMADRKKAEAQLLHAQKLDAIGELAGGIAHDFNNVLTGILGYTSLAQEALPKDGEAARDLDHVIKAATRAKELVAQILAFSRHSSFEINRKPLRLDEVLAEVMKLLRPTLPPSIDIQTRIGTGLPPILADATQMHQVIVNLCINASHAMPDGGRITAVLDWIEHQGPEPLISIDSLGEYSLPPGRYLALSIQDNGTGIPRGIIARIFEPFFTTKADKGSGMGLSVVYGIVQNHGGQIRVYTEPGLGTHFKIYLPAADVRDLERPSEPVSVRGGSESILVIDDEESLARMMARQLGRLGYRVAAVTSGVEALKLFKENPRAFDLVITDHAMPGMSGAQFAEALLEIRPDIPIILTSGFNATLDEQRFKSIRVWKFMNKPFVGRDLEREVRRALDHIKKQAGTGASL